MVSTFIAASDTGICDRRRIDTYLAGNLDNEKKQLDVLHAHLDSCIECRCYLEQQAARPDILSDARKLLVDEIDSPTIHTSSTPPSQDEALIANPESHTVKSVLGLLVPSDNPNSLGRLGIHEIKGVIGSGGMGVVLKALDPTLDRIVAIKVLAPHLANSGAARKRFAREAKAAAAVIHPNVIPIHAVDSANDLPYLVMAYIKGGSLHNRIDHEGRLPTRELLRIGSQIAAGLASAHDQGLVHRDIKPANILLEEGIERVSITDFGLARAVDDNSITHCGLVAGTPQFMSPEQTQGEAVDPISDLFSLGSVLYTLATGYPPFRSDSSYGVMRKICESEPKQIQELNPEFPFWLSRYIEKLMSKDPARRPESAAKVAEQLESALAHLQQPLTVPLPEEMAALTRTSPVSTRLVGLMTIVCLILAALGATFLSPVLGTQDFVERNAKSKYIGQLLANWKSQSPGAVEQRQLQDQIVAFHNLQAGKPGTPEFFETKRTWANEMLPILLAGVSQKQAEFLAEFTQPFEAIHTADREAANGKPTEPVGWEWQEAHMLAKGRTGRIGDAYEISDRLIKKVQTNLAANKSARADFFGAERPLDEILRECLVHRRVIEAINGPARPGPADGVAESIIDPESEQQMNAIIEDLGKNPDNNSKVPNDDLPEAKRKLAPVLKRSLDAIPNRPALLQADKKYVAILEVDGDNLVAKALRDDELAGMLGVACWQRLTTLFPPRYRKGLVQFNIQKGNRWAGFFNGSGANDVGRKGYSLSIARYLALKEKNVDDPLRPLTPWRGTLDWTTVHEMGHYICLTTNAIELFSQAFDGDDKPQPSRRKQPNDYPKDGSPVVDGNFVTSYAERTPGDEEVCETLTTYLLIDKLPTNDSLVARKIRFFNKLPGYPELRKHIQNVTRKNKPRSSD